MAEIETKANSIPEPKPLQAWQGPLACFLLAIVGCMGPDITPSIHFRELSHYAPRYVILAFAFGLGISAIRSKHRINRLIGIAVVFTSGWMILYVVSGCLGLHSY